MKNGVDRVASAELQAIIALEKPALYPLAVDKGSVLAALILDVELAVLRSNQRMVARDPRVGDRQVFLHFPTDSERTVIQIQRALFRSLNKNQAGEDPGLNAGDRADDGLGGHNAKPGTGNNASKSRLGEGVQGPRLQEIREKPGTIQGSKPRGAWPGKLKGQLALLPLGQPECPPHT